jgi:hypothetical protein
MPHTRFISQTGEEKAMRTVCYALFATTIVLVVVFFAYAMFF